MTLSMTAFASLKTETQTAVLRWDVKSFNHRYFEPTFKLPEQFQDLEQSFREDLRQKVHRGKVFCQLFYENTLENTNALEVNEAFVEQLLVANNKIKEYSEKKGQETKKLSTLELLKWPGVLQVQTHDFEKMREVSQTLFSDTLVELVKARSKEGEALKHFIIERLGTIQVLLQNIKKRLPAILLMYREKLMSRFQELNISPDLNRLEQEMLYLIQKYDVAEEIDRLATHSQAVFEALNFNGQVGRRLDFLVQEMNRESNTLAAKSIDGRLTQESVEIKVLIEQIREQVQNLE